MANWGNVQQGLTSGFNIGAAGGGRMSGLGMAIKNVADRLRAERESGEDMARKKELLRYEAGLKKEEPDISKSILGMISGLVPPEEVLPQEQIAQIAPRSLGTAMGGEVLAPEGATYKDGRIVSSTGEDIGSYMEGYEPKPFSPAIGSSIGNKFGITKEEAGRKLLGLPKAEKQTGQITPSVAMNILSDSMKSNQFKKEFGEDAFQELRRIATSGIMGGSPKKSLLRKDTSNIMDTNF